MLCVVYLSDYSVGMCEGCHEGSCALFRGVVLGFRDHASERVVTNMARVVEGFHTILCGYLSESSLWITLFTPYPQVVDNH